MTINLTPETALRLISFSSSDRLDEAQRILNAVAAQRAVNENPATPALHSSFVQINLQDAEQLAQALFAVSLYAGLKLEWKN